jgi:hypothetical protein
VKFQLTRPKVGHQAPPPEAPEGDRQGTDRDDGGIQKPVSRDLLDEIRAKLTPRTIALSATTSSDELLADGDDTFLESYVDDQVDEAACHAELARQIARGTLHPVRYGSAITGAGVADLVTAMAELFPATERTGDGPLHATVFKIDRSRAGEKIAYARLLLPRRNRAHRPRLGDRGRRGRRGARGRRRPGARVA